MDDINLWTVHVPHQSKINQYSSLSEVDSDTNNKQHYNHEVNRETESKSDTSVVPVHNLRPWKRTYHSNRSRRDASDMCQNILHQPRQCHKPTPWSEPSTSRINSQKHAVKPPPTNKYTYPVVNEKLK